MPSGAKKRKAAKKKKEAHPNTNTNLSISISTNNPRGQGIQYLKFSTFAVFSFELGPIRPIHTCPICHSNHALYFFHQSLFFDVVFGHFGLMGICYAFCHAWFPLCQTYPRFYLYYIPIHLWIVNSVFFNICFYLFIFGQFGLKGVCSFCFAWFQRHQTNSNLSYLFFNYTPTFFGGQFG